MSDEPVLPRSPNAKHAATDRERTSLILVCIIICLATVELFVLGPDCRTVRRPNQSSGIMGAVDCGTGAPIGAIFSVASPHPKICSPSARPGGACDRLSRPPTFPYRSPRRRPPETQLHRLTTRAKG